jgi:hypothetical protein
LFMAKPTILRAKAQLRLQIVHLKGDWQPSSLQEECQLGKYKTLFQQSNAY